MEARVSVVIPAYNAEKFIGETLCSVLEQTVKPYEIVVVDDASRDTTREIAEVILSQQSMVKYQLLGHLSNGGIGVSRQDGALAAKGDFVAYLSSDDLYLPTFLEESLKQLGNENGTYSDYYQWKYVDGSQTVFNAPICRNDGEFMEKVIEWALQKNMFVMFSSVIMPKWWFKELHFEPHLRHGEDLIFLLDSIVAYYKWKHVEKPLVQYRIHPQQGTHTQDKQEWFTLWSYNRERLESLGLDPHAIEAAYRKCYRNDHPRMFDRAIAKAKRQMRKVFFSL
ncbi:glycosyltransferase family 2 protein [Candidatus Bathyarchaeota archaeon]|nr:glycosyltransferase family 2 protein [Candidatus Bathyarchaeota archaeon]